MEARRVCWWTTRIALLGVGLVFLMSAASAQAASRLFWGDEGTGTISSAKVDNSGGGTNLSTTGASPISEVSGTAIDIATGRIYWVQQDETTISFANLDGSGGGDLNTSGATVDSAEGLAIDPAAGKLYWANEEGTSPISFARLDGSGGGDLDVTGATPDAPSGLAIDPASGKVYWANFGNNTISFANLNGSGGGGELDITGATPDGPAGVAIDPTRGKIYWTNFTGSTISFANLDDSGGGGDLNTSGAPISSPWGLAIDPTAGKIYWANFDTTPSLAFAKLLGGGGGQLNVDPLTPESPDFPSLLETPTNTDPPSITGGSALGSTLECSQGTWASDQLGSYLFQAPRSFAFSWTLNSAPLSGATSRSVTATSPGNYVCDVTASNAAGGAAQISAGFTVSQPPPPPPPPTPTLSGLRVSPAKLSLAGRKVKGSCVKPIKGNKGSRPCRRAIQLQISYALNVAAKVTFIVTSEAVGRKGNGRCMKPTTKNRKHSRCTRLIPIHGQITNSGKAGANSLNLNGTIGGHKLAPGTYRLTGTPSGGASRTVKFKLTG